jgi:ATP-dependent DNA helicase RecQ
VSQWGDDFRPAFLEIAAAVKAGGQPTLLALTATATGTVLDDIVRSFGLRRPNIIRTGTLRENLQYRVVQVSAAGGRDGARRAVQVKREQRHELIASLSGSGIVYAATVADVERIHGWLAEAGKSVSHSHGRLTSSVHDRALEQFMSGTTHLMIATNAFGMGIDNADIRFVIHYQMPGSLDAYYRETGRAGRDGAPADCILLFDLNDRRIQQFFLIGRYPSPELETLVRRGGRAPRGGHDACRAQARVAGRRRRHAGVRVEHVGCCAVRGDERA